MQFQILDVTQTEKDASGKCQVTYKSLDPHTFLKTKTDCVSGKTVPLILHPDKVSTQWTASLCRVVRYKVLGNVQELAEFHITCIRNEINISDCKVCNCLTIQGLSAVLYL
jgi:hypothetical protein